MLDYKIFMYVLGYLFAKMRLIEKANMKSIKSLLLLGAMGLFAASCGESTETETTATDTVTTVPVTVDTVAGGTMDAATATGGTTDTTVVDTTKAAH